MGSAAALLLSLLSLACWGTWSNTAKAAAAVPFPLFYLDYSLGVAATASIAFLTVGQLDFTHDELEGCEVHIAYAFAAGSIFNVANVLLVAGIGIAGLAVAFPVGIGMALVLGTLLTYYIDGREQKPSFLFAGVAAGFIAILFQVAADALRKRDQAAALAKERAPAGTVEVSPGSEDEALSVLPPAPTVAAGNGLHGLIVCVASGVLMALWSPLSALSMRRDADDHCSGCLTPYGSSLIFCTAVLLTSPAICAVLMRRPLIGRRCSFSEYRQQTRVNHGYGWLGGTVWAIGTISNLVSGATLGLALSYAIGQSAPMVATLWGLLWYKEFEGAGPRTLGLVCCCMAAYSCAIALTAMSKQ